jgi:hypothetical protein
MEADFARRRHHSACEDIEPRFHHQALHMALGELMQMPLGVKTLTAGALSRSAVSDFVQRVCSSGTLIPTSVDLLYTRHPPSVS